MPDIEDGGSVAVQGSARQPYLLRNMGGVYSCSCPAWRNQSQPIERRTCKHLRGYRGEEQERIRVGCFPTEAKTIARRKPAAPPLLLAEAWDHSADLTGWWLSEKLDGVRAWWDGHRFLSRQGNLYHAPAWFTAGLPEMPLDGELWLDRKAFQRTVSIVRRHDHSAQWGSITFMVFDAPTAGGDFEARQALLADLFRSGFLAFAKRLPHAPCRGVAHLQAELARVEALGGEGLMLRQPGSAYTQGRSATLLKVKRFHDAEGRVLEHLAGKGRHAGRLGAVVVLLPNGQTCSVGSGFSDAQRQNPPPVGSTITFRYQELTDRGVPRFPTFLRVRGDGESVSA